jgi:hypothetical protein
VRCLFTAAEEIAIVGWIDVFLLDLLRVGDYY